MLFSDTQNRGVSYIGMCHKSVKSKDVARMFRGLETIKIHFLNRTFNESGCPAFEGISQDPRPMILHISLINGPGLRNRRLQRHEFLYGYTIRSAESAIVKRDRRVLKQIRKASLEAKALIRLRGRLPTVLRIKPILESDFRKPARRIVFREVKAVLSTVEIIDNPVRDSCLLGALCETHGMNTEGEILDLDGLDYDYADAKTWEREGRQKVGMFVWKFCNNGFRPGEEWRPPLARTNWCGKGEIAFFRRWLGN
jgi:hypothetical protein